MLLRVLSSNSMYCHVQMMRGHSNYTSWYFVERAEIGNINVNVTISLSSSILNTHPPGSVSLPENRGGLFSRVIGASGFQLINVNNVPLQLSAWSTDTKLIGRKALQSSLTRHYIGQSIREAHKVCCSPSTLPSLHAPPPLPQSPLLLLIICCLPQATKKLPQASQNLSQLQHSLLFYSQSGFEQKMRGG